MSSNGNLLKIGCIAFGAAILVDGGVFLGVHFTKSDNQTTVQETAPAITAVAETQPEC